MNLEAAISRLLNSCVAANEVKSAELVRCLFSINKPSLVIQQILNKLESSKEASVKLRAVKIYFSFMNEKGNELQLDDSTLLNHILTLIKEAPAPLPSSESLDFIKTVQYMLTKFSDTKPSKIYNEIVKLTALYTPLGTVLVTQLSSKLCKNTLKLVILSLKHPDPPQLLAASIFFKSTTFNDLPKDAKEEFTKNDGVKVINNVVTNIIPQGILTNRLYGLNFLGEAFHFLTPKDAIDIAAGIIPTLIQLLHDVQLKTHIVKVLAKVPVYEENPNFNSATLLSSALPALTFKLEQEQSDYVDSVLDFVMTRSTHPALLQTLKFMIDSPDTYHASILICCRINIFSTDESFIKPCFPEKLSHTQALAVATGIEIMGKTKEKMNPNMIQHVVNCLFYILTNPQILDDIFIQDHTFKALKMIPDTIVECADSFIDAIFVKLALIKDSDILSTIGEMFDQILLVIPNVKPRKIEGQKFSTLIIQLLIKYLENTDDKEFQDKLVTIMLYIAAAYHDNPVQKFEYKSLPEIIDQVIPDDLVDIVRTDSMLLSQQRPIASLIGISLPNCTPFLPTLCRVFKDISPPDPELTQLFFRSAAKRSFDSFLPHLLKFTEPIEIPTNFLKSLVTNIVNGKTERPSPYMKEIFNCINFIVETMTVSAGQIETLLQIAESSFIDPENVINEALPTIINISKLEQSEYWPESLLQKVFSCHMYAPCFTLLLQHTPQNSTLIGLAAANFAHYLAYNKIDDEAFCSACFDLSPTQETLVSLFRAASANFDSPDPKPLLHFCFVTTKQFKQLGQEIIVDLSEFLVSISRFSLSTLPTLRVQTRVILLNLYGIKLPADLSSPLLQADLKLSAYEILKFASCLFHNIFSQLKPERILDLAVFVINCKPFSLVHSLLFKGLIEVAPDLIVEDPKKVLIHIFDVAEDTEPETRIFLIETLKLIAKSQMKTFLNALLSRQLTKFGEELIAIFVRNKEFKDLFLENYFQIIMSLTVPALPKDQANFMTFGYFQALICVIQADITSDLVHDIFGTVISHILIWLSLIYVASSSISSSSIQKLEEQLVGCVEMVFNKLGRTNHEPIEFSLRSPRDLYQSLGSLANALLMVDYQLLIDFCKNCFVLLKSHLQQTVLTASLCLSRLFHRCIECNSEDAINLRPKLQETVSFSFVASSDENCRTLSGVMNDLFSVEILSGFTNDDMVKMIDGTLRGISFQSLELKHENFSFLYKLVQVAPKEVIVNYKDQLWEIVTREEVTPNSLEATIAILKIDKDIEKLVGNMTIDNILFEVTNENMFISSKSEKLLDNLCETDDQDLVQKLAAFLGKDRFVTTCEQFILKISKGRLNQTSLKMIKTMSMIDKTIKEKAATYLLSIIEDFNNPLNRVVLEMLPEIMNN